MVTGNTRLTGLLGYPVRHTASPAFHNAGFKALGLDWIYVPLEVKPENLKDAVIGLSVLGFAGANCTIPHKEKVIHFLDELSHEAQAIGAVNTIKVENGRLKGFNTDGNGFMRSLKEVEPSGIANKSVFIIGSGGAGRAVAVQCAIDKAKTVRVCDKDKKRAELLAEHIRERCNYMPVEFIPHNPKQMIDSLKESDVLVDATPLGMHPGDPLSIEPEWLSSELLVIDLVYNPPLTPLLKTASSKGCRTLNGLGMLLHQGALAFEIWTEKNPPIHVMRKALETAVYGS